MRPTARNKADRMVAAEERKLGPMVQRLLDRYGFGPPDKNEYRYADVPALGSGWRFRVWHITDGDGHPWLACCFESPGPSGPAGTRTYAHILGGEPNPFTGKFNCHIFGRFTAEEMVFAYENHIRRALMNPGLAPWLASPTPQPLTKGRR